MHRRRFLVLLAGASSAVLAGCAEASSGGEATSTATSAGGSGTPLPTISGSSSDELPVPKEHLQLAGVKDAIPAVVAASGGTLAAYDRRVEGRARTFERPDAAHLRAAGSRWRITTGRAVDGPQAGKTLTPASALSPMFWFAWRQFNPTTEVWSPGG